MVAADKLVCAARFGRKNARVRLTVTAEPPMSDDTRASRQCSPAQLKPERLQPLRAYAAQHSLGDVETALPLAS